MALSTSMPMAMISAPSEIRSISMFNSPMNSRVPSTVSSRVLPTTTPMRQPMARHSTPITMATDMARLSRKSLMASLTTWCCS